MSAGHAFDAASSTTTLPLRVIIDGTEFADGTLTMRHYSHEPESLAVARLAAAARAGLLAIADDLTLSYALPPGTDTPREDTMSARDYLTHEDIDVRFGFHTAAGRPDVGERHDYVRYLCRELAHAFIDQLPEGPDKRLAVERLEDAMMRANRAIAIGFRTASAVPSAPAPVGRPVPRPPAARPSSAYDTSRPPRPVAYRTMTPPPVPGPRPAGDDQGKSA